MAERLVAVHASKGSLRESVSLAEWEARVNLAAAFRVAYHLGWNRSNRNHMTLRIADAPDHFLMNAQDYGWHEITASNLLKIDLSGEILSISGMTPGPAGLNFHSAILREKPNLNATLHLHPMNGVVVSAMEEGLQFFDQGACSIYGEISYHPFEGLADEKEEARSILKELGEKHAMIMLNHGLLSVGRTMGEGFLIMAALVTACETQVRLMSTGAKRRPISAEICERAYRQMTGREPDRPRGELEWRMYRRLAEQLDPGFAV